MCACACACTCLCMCVCVCLCVRACVQGCVCAHTFLCMCVCVYASVCVRGVCVCMTTATHITKFMWKSEDSWRELVLYFLRVGSGAGRKVVRPVGKHSRRLAVSLPSPSLSEMGISHQAWSMCFCQISRPSSPRDTPVLLYRCMLLYPALFTGVKQIQVQVLRFVQ